MAEYSTQLKVVSEENGMITLDNGLQLHMSKVDFLLMQLLQGYVLEILTMVDEFCRKHEITYYLGEGTLLGAIRHHGYIPWDDDVDLLMPRADYDRFLELAKTELPDGYQIDSYQTNPKHASLASFVQMTKKVPYIKKRQEGVALNIGPALDVFPLDFVPDDYSDRLIERGKKASMIRRAIWIKSGLHNRAWYHTLKSRVKLYYPHKIYGMFRSMKSMHQEANALLTETNDPNCEYLACFASLYKIQKEVFKKEYFGEPRLADFEGHQFPIPAETEKILSHIYGNYMAYPPVEKRKSKHFFCIDAQLLEEMKDDERIKPVWDAIQEAGGKIPEPGYDRKYESVLKAAVKTVNAPLRKVERKFQAKLHAFKENVRNDQIHKYMKLPIEEKTVVYDAFSGLGILDSPRAIFQGLLAREEFNDYTHVWAINDRKLSEANLKEFEQLPNVKFVKRNFLQYIKSLFTAKYIVCNSSVPPYYTRRSEQVYVNTWHGVPTKVMGYERPGQRIGSTENIVHNFLNATHIIAANHFTGERMYKQAYMLDGMYRGRLLDEPLPRTDTLHNMKREEITRKLNQIGIKTDKKIVLYAPTWKGKSYKELDNDVDELKAAVKILRDNIDTNEYNVYLRVHYFLYRTVQMDKELSELCIPFTIDTGELLSAVDILISDYSSIFFDFLGTRRPILFYVPDLRKYSENRGLYIPMEDLPGPVSEHLEGIAEHINNIETVKDEYKDKYDTMYDWCCSKEDGHCVDRIIDDVFLNKRTATLGCKTEKERIAILADFAKRFTVQNALLELLDRLDYDKYDVTLITSGGMSEAQKEVLENLNSRVRILINTKRVYRVKKKVKKVYADLRSRKTSVAGAASALGFGQVWQRVTGGAEFDKLFVIPTDTSAEHWLVLSYVARAKEKYLLQNKKGRCRKWLSKVKLCHIDQKFSSLNSMFEGICPPCVDEEACCEAAEPAEGIVPQEEQTAAMAEACS